MRKLTQFILFATLCSFIILFSQYTLAKYRDKVNMPIQSEVASWNIKLNNEYINNKSILSNSIQPVFEGSDNVKEGVLAPGSIGYFDIIVDATKVDVTFDYRIELSNSQNSIADLVIKSYSINGGDIVTYDADSFIAGTIVHNSSLTTIRVYIEWNDGENSTMSNDEDTDVAVNGNGTISIDASITFTQKK